MIPPDAQLATFTAAFDTDAIAHRLAQCLPDERIETCRVERFRYRRGERASFLYELTCARNGNGGSRKIWANGSLYRTSKAKRLHSELRDAAYVPDLDMLVEFFPTDRRMRELRRIVDGTCGELTDAFLQNFGGGAWEIVATEIVPVRYRPGIAAVFRAIVNARNGTETRKKTFYVKAYAGGDPASIFARCFHARHGDRFSVLKPLAVLPELKTIVWPEAPGDSLAAEISSDRPDTDKIGAMAQSLSEFHRSDLCLPVTSPLEIAAGTSKRNAEFVAAIVPWRQAMLHDLAQCIPEPFADFGFAPTHQDMKPEHLLWHGDKATLLDVEAMEDCDPALDVGNLLARLHSGPAVFGYDGNACQIAMRAFASGMLSQTRTNGPARLAAGFALGKLKIASFAIAHQLPGWPQIVDRVLEDASRALTINGLPYG